MVATVSISETNSSNATITASITNLNMGSTDSVNLVSTNYPIIASTNAYEKWLRFNWSTGSASQLTNFVVWANTTNPLKTGVWLFTNICTTYSSAQTFPTSSGPSCVDRSTTYNYINALTTSRSTSPQLGVGGLTTGILSTYGYTDYIIFQLQTSSDGVTGASSTYRIYFGYTEVP